MKLIIGLGNPGKKYSATRHNIGFMVIDKFASKHSISLSEDKKHVCEMTKFKLGGHQVIVMKPLTYMNNAGDSVRSVCEYYNIDVKDILFISDDKDMNMGCIKAKQNGSSGGQNGIKSIINNMKTQEINRIKIGIGQPMGDTSAYVLAPFNKEQKLILDKVIDHGSNAIEEYILNGFSSMANKFSGDLNEK